MSHAINGQLVPVGGGEVIPLVRTPMVIGRRETCDICLQFPNISGQHCELRFQNGFWSIRDLGSTNGVKINGERAMSKPLKPGDEIGIAKRRYTIQYDPPEEVMRLLEELLADEQEDIMGKSLLEKAGLVSPRNREKPGR